jgi:hypothetical protein
MLLWVTLIRKKYQCYKFIDMKKRIIAIIISSVALFASCDPASHDITIINRTSDSLYFRIHWYKSENDYRYNFAYDSVAAHDAAINRYDIAYNMSSYKLLPNGTIQPGKTSSSWKKEAKIKGGLTLLFYKRDIQHLPQDTLLSYKNIYKRLDLTTKQLDSLNYSIELK